ncbi:MAG: leucine-rich repeat domain-containing protein, partial [Candidatus Sigynarchaeota archaeon]
SFMEAASITIDLDSMVSFIDLHDIDDDTRVCFTSKRDIDQAKAHITQLLVEGPFTRLPSFIDEFPNLKRLILGSHEIDMILEESIHLLESLKHFTIFGIGNHVKSRKDIERPIPDVVSRLGGIEELAMSVASPALLPRCLPRMPNLRCLRIYGTIPTFPDAVFGVRGLQELYIAGVGMERFPAAKTSGLVALERLDISRNPITTLPGWLFPGSRMRVLDASGTKITRLPGCVARWKHLEVLDVSHSAIEALPEAIGGCKRLRELRARNTPLAALPESIGDCEALEVLDIADTKVKELPASLGLCARLREIDAGHTPITSLPAALAACTNLEHVQYHVLRAIPPEIEALVVKVGRLQLDQDLDAAFEAEFEAKLAAFEADDEHDDEHPAGDA